MKTGEELIHEINACTLEKGSMAFWWLGQLGYAVKLGSSIIYLDPFLSERSDRNIPPLLKPEDITHADFIFGSHDHIDHIDRPSWHRLAASSPNVKFVVPGMLAASLSKELDIPENRFIEADDGTSIKVDGLRITGIAAAHEFLDQDPETKRYPYMGFIIEGNGCVIYHSGDTCIYDGLHAKLKQWGKIDVMMIPINGRDAVRYRRNCIGNMTYQEAVDLVGMIRPGLAVPGHYEMFSANSENPQLFADYLDAKYPSIRCWIGKHGERADVQT